MLESMARVDSQHRHRYASQASWQARLYHLFATPYRGSHMAPTKFGLHALSSVRADIAGHILTGLGPFGEKMSLNASRIQMRFTSAF